MVVPHCLSKQTERSSLDHSFLHLFLWSLSPTLHPPKKKFRSFSSRLQGEADKIFTYSFAKKALKNGEGLGMRSLLSNFIQSSTEQRKKTRLAIISDLGLSVNLLNPLDFVPLSCFIFCSTGVQIVWTGTKNSIQAQAQYLAA